MASFIVNQTAQQENFRFPISKLRTIDHDFPKHLAILHVFVRGADIFQGKSTIDDWFESSGKHVCQHLVQLAHASHVGAK